MWKNVFLCITLLSLNGCVLVWGRTYNVEFANSSSVTIRYSTSFTDSGYVQGVAQASCDQYGKDAVPGSWSDSGIGLRTETYFCVRRHT
jgi:hypothetical protein